MPDLAAMSLAQASARESVTRRLVALLSMMFAELDKQDRDASGRYALRAAEMTRQAQSASAGGAWAFLDAVLRLVFGIEPPAGSPTIGANLRGVPQAEVALRPVIEYRWLLSDKRRIDLARDWNATHPDDLREPDYYDLSPVEAERLVLERIEKVAEDDVRLAERIASQERLESVPQVTGYRRIIHPERSESGTCGLCVVASDRVYRKGTLLPVHTGCQCTVAPITADLDPGRELNKQDMRRLYAAAGGTGKTGLSNVRVKAHGELGPQLAA